MKKLTDFYWFYITCSSQKMKYTVFCTNKNPNMKIGGQSPMAANARYLQIKGNKEEKINNKE